MTNDSRKRIRDGDPTEFAALFDAHARAIYRYGLRMTGDTSMAEEVLSLTFLEAWRLRSAIREGGDSLRPWLYAIAVNVSRNLRRAARRHREALARLPLAEDTPDFADEVADVHEQRVQLVHARRALEQLKPAEREVIALCVWEGLSYAEAAEVLDVPIGTVRSRLSRARAKVERRAVTSRISAQERKPALSHSKEIR